MDIFQGAGTEIVGLNPMNPTQQVWNLRQQMYAQAGVISMASSLRAEALLTDGVQRLELFFAQNNARTPITPTERRLLQNDTFTVMGMSLHLGIVNVADTVETEAEHQQMTLHTFPNPLLFTTGELESIYNGGLSMLVDSTRFIDWISGRDFYRVGTSQALVGSSAVSNAPIQADEWTYQQYGQRSLTPTIELSGRANIETTLNMGTSVDLGGTATENYYLVGQLFGFLNTGASSIYEQWLAELAKNASLRPFLPNEPMFKKARS